MRSDQQASENDKKKRSSDSELEEVFQPGIPTTVYGIFATTKTTKKTNKQNDTNHQHSNKTATQLARHSSKQSIEITQGYKRKGSNLAASRRRNQGTGSTVFCFPFDLTTNNTEGIRNCNKLKAGQPKQKTAKQNTRCITDEKA